MSINTMIVVLTAVVCLLGLAISIWSYINTRKRYYEDYASRKRHK